MLKSSSLYLYSSNLGTFWLKIEQFWPQVNDTGSWEPLVNIYYRIFYELWTFADFDRLCQLEKRGDEIKKKSSPVKQWFQTRRFLWEFPIRSYVKLSSAVVAILVGVLKCRTQFWKRTTQESFQQSLVEIGSVVSQEKIFFLISSPLFSTHSRT
jgi:hypothetical protein